MLAAAVSGAADYVDTDETARIRATTHATLMVVALLLLLVSIGLRATGPADRTIPIALSVIAFLIVTAGAYIGGDVVFVLGNMVSRHAFRGAGTKWIKLDTGEISDLSMLPDATPTKARAGINDLVLVRLDGTIHAVHAVCAHAGGPLAQGTVVDGCIQCPWHGSRFRMTDGHVRRGPAVYDQPSYEIRGTEGGGYEVRRAVAT
jgi:nitrite reductase/ring-hydroxylating ferredoxin subunit